ncbi:type VII secretion protein EccB [Streptomyces sp. NPDC002755]
MQSRRDQVQAHRFVVSRLTTGLLRADPDDPETPTYRTNRGVVIGAAIGVLLSIGFLAYGFVRPGGADSWRQGGKLLVEKETGTRYLYDGTLRPVRNYASARLIVGSGLTTEEVSANSLLGTAHGPPVGIEGAPDAYPSAAQLDTGPWEVCASTRPTDSGKRTPATSLVVDAQHGGTAIQHTQALLVRNIEDETLYLLWQGNRFKMTAGSATADALGYSADSPMDVSGAFLDTLPAGTDLAPPAASGQGKQGTELDGRPTRIGQVFTVQTPGSPQQYYLLQQAGLVPITTTQAALALTGPGVRDEVYAGSAPAAIPLSADALSKALAPGSGSGEGRSVEEAGKALPPSPPDLVPVRDGTDACARLTPRGERGNEISLLLTDSAALTESATPPTQAGRPACLAVDTISVPPSGGSLVKALGSSGRAIGDTTYLVTDTGVKYRIPTDDDAQALGFDRSQAQALPSPLLTMLPTGPDLSKEAALAGRSEATGTPECSDASTE